MCACNDPQTTAMRFTTVYLLDVMYTCCCFPTTQEGYTCVIVPAPMRSRAIEPTSSPSPGARKRWSPSVKPRRHRVVSPERRMDTSNPARQNLEDILKDPTFEDEVLNSIFAEAHALPAQAGDAVDGGTGRRALQRQVADDAMKASEDGGMLLNNVAEDGLTLPQKPSMEHQQVVSLPIFPPLRMKGTQGLHPKPTDARTLPMSPRRTRAMRASMSDTVLVQGGTAARNKFMPSGSTGEHHNAATAGVGHLQHEPGGQREPKGPGEGARPQPHAGRPHQGTIFKVTEPRARRVLTPRSLRRNARTQDAQDSVIRIFRKFDVDGSGSVDRREFTAAIMATVEGATSDVSDLFIEFDLDNSGKISYKEMHEVMTHAAKEGGAPKAAVWHAAGSPSYRTLQRRKQVLLEVHRKFKSNTVGTAADGTRLPDLTSSSASVCAFRDTGRRRARSFSGWRASRSRTSWRPRRAFARTTPT